MIRNRIYKLCSVAAAAACLFGVVIATPSLAPTAGADPLDPIRGAVNGKRAASPCGALNYSIALEGEAQARVNNHLPGVPPAGQYKGTVRKLWASFEHEEDAINDIIATYGDAINDCQYKDFGVGFARDDSHDLSDVAVALGVPAEAPKAADIQCPAGSVSPTVPAGQQCQAAPPVQCPPNSKTPTVPAGQQCEAAPPTTCPPGSLQAEVPPGGTCAAPTNVITMDITQSGLNANVAIHNGSGIDAQCAYDAKRTSGLVGGPVHRDLSVPANSTGTIDDLLWPPLLVTYTATAKCTGTYDGKQVTLGTAQQTVSG